MAGLRREGTVVDADPARAVAIVELDPASSCARCARGRGCGLGLLDGAGGVPPRLACTSSGGTDAAPRRGSRVTVELDVDPDWLRVVASAFLPPTLGLLGGVGAVTLTGGGEGAAVFCGLAGLACGTILCRRLLGALDAPGEVVPDASGTGPGARPRIEPGRIVRVIPDSPP